MHIKTMIIGAGLVLAAGCASASQSTPQSEVAGVRCGGLQNVEAQVAATLAPQNVQRVDAVHATVYMNGEHLPQYVAGASLYVPAEPGMSEAYLERALSCHAAARSQANASDPLQVAGVSDVRVQSRGQSFQIDITGVDREAGEQILQRAEALVHGAGEVHVRQIASLSSHTL